MKTLIILSARPACGKSTWAKKYQEENPNTLIISSDAIRFEVTGQTQDFSKQPLVWEIFSKRIHEYATTSDDVTVILDALNDLNILRKKYVQENPEFDKYVLVLFPRTKEQIVISNKKRDEENWVDDEALSRLIDKFEDPDIETLEMFDEVISNPWEDR